jgi:hypothetical protein
MERARTAVTNSVELRRFHLSGNVRRAMFVATGIFRPADSGRMDNLLKGHI